jgi:hypothetical protein
VKHFDIPGVCLQGNRHATDPAGFCCGRQFQQGFVAVAPPRVSCDPVGGQDDIGIAIAAGNSSCQDGQKYQIEAFHCVLQVIDSHLFVE